MDDDAGSDGRLVQKVRLKHLFPNEASLQRIADAVARMHRVVESGYILGKAYYLRRLDALLSANGGAFDHGVASALEAEFPLTDAQFEDWLDVASTDLERRRGRPLKDEKKQRFERLDLVYSDVAQLGGLPTTKTPCTNLSNAKGYAAQQMSVAYCNNVHAHFDAYPKRLAECRFVQILTDHLQRTPTLRERQEAEGRARRAVVHLLRGQDPTQDCPALYHAWLTEHASKLCPPATRANNPDWRFYDQKARPERWLPYMVMINRWLEAADHPRLLSPLPLRTSFVPCHLRLCTQGLWDLLVPNQDAMKRPRRRWSDCRWDGRLATALAPRPSPQCTVSLDGVARTAASRRTRCWVR